MVDIGGPGGTRVANSILMMGNEKCRVCFCKVRYLVLEYLLSVNLCAMISAFECVAGSELLCILCHLISARGRYYHPHLRHKSQVTPMLDCISPNILLFKYLKMVFGLSKYQSLWVFMLKELYPGTHTFFGPLPSAEVWRNRTLPHVVRGKTWSRKFYHSFKCLYRKSGSKQDLLSVY